MKRLLTYLLIFIGSSSALLTSYLATAHCCSRLNVFAMLGLTQPGCMGISQYRHQFMSVSLFCFAATLVMTFYGNPEATKQQIGFWRTAGLSLLGIFVGMHLFVIP